jgi:hypothetical protein
MSDQWAKRGDVGLRAASQISRQIGTPRGSCEVAGAAQDGLQHRWAKAAHHDECVVWVLTVDAILECSDELAEVEWTSRAITGYRPPAAAIGPAGAVLLAAYSHRFPLHSLSIIGNMAQPPGRDLDAPAWQPYSLQG